MRELSPRRMLSGPVPTPDRILFHTVWSRGGHRNQRYAELLPRLERIDLCAISYSDRRGLRGAQFRALSASKVVRQRRMLGAAARRYAALLVDDRDQIDHFPGPILADCDDPKFTDAEVAQIQRDNVVAYVVVNERVAGLYRDLGIEKPCYILPHGVSTKEVDPAEVAEVAAREREGDGLVVGYMASWLRSKGDRGGDNPLHNVDHLLDLWEEISVRIPNSRLWLLGEASDRIARRCAQRDDIVTFGRVPRSRMLAHVANFDIALYPRTADQGYQAAKTIEYMGCGVPTVAYDYEVVSDVRDAGAGLLVSTPREFVDAVERLAGDSALRARLAEAARRAAGERDWDLIAERYSEILDRHLPVGLQRATA